MAMKQQNQPVPRAVGQTMPLTFNPNVLLVLPLKFVPISILGNNVGVGQLVFERVDLKFC
jgi:hypothetical protein